jgi:hypothetical protein
MLISIVLFTILQYLDYSNKQKNKAKYDLLTLKNFATFIVIYIIVAIIYYMIFTMNNVQTGGKSSIKNEYVTPDPVMLRKIAEPMYTGFMPHINDD